MEFAKTGPPAKPAKRVRWGEEEQRNERAFAARGSKGYGVCSDDVSRETLEFSF